MEKRIDRIDEKLLTRTQLVEIVIATVASAIGGRSPRFVIFKAFGSCTARRPRS